jgi:hypothetical protein
MVEVRQFERQGIVALSHPRVLSCGAPATKLTSLACHDARTRRDIRCRAPARLITPLLNQARTKTSEIHRNDSLQRRDCRIMQWQALFLKGLSVGKAP